MRVEIEDLTTNIYPSEEEVKELCRPGQGADSCIWLMMGTDGWFCSYYNRQGISLTGETLEERWRKGLTVAKRDGCDKVKNIVFQNVAMKRVECLGIAGKFPTPEGMRTFYDTGRKISAVDVAEATILQHSYFAGIGEQAETTKQLYAFITRVAKRANVHPIGYAGLAEDGRILVTEPWFEAKDD